MSFTLQVRSPGDGTATDDLGNPIGESTPREWTVWGIAPGKQGEPAAAEREAVPVEWTIYAPKAGAPTALDQVEVDGDWLEVNGKPQDWTRGPYGPGAAGVVVELRAVQG